MHYDYHIKHAFVLNLWKLKIQQKLRLSNKHAAIFCLRAYARYGYYYSQGSDEANKWIIFVFYPFGA